MIFNRKSPMDKKLDQLERLMSLRQQAEANQFIGLPLFKENATKQVGWYDKAIEIVMRRSPYTEKHDG